jgi:hypothetical protein
MLWLGAGIASSGAETFLISDYHPFRRYSSEPGSCMLILVTLLWFLLLVYTMEARCAAKCGTSRV